MKELEAKLTKGIKELDQRVKEINEKMYVLNGDVKKLVGHTIGYPVETVKPVEPVETV